MLEHIEPSARGELTRVADALRGADDDQLRECEEGWRALDALGTPGSSLDRRSLDHAMEAHWRRAIEEHRRGERALSPVALELAALRSRPVRVRDDLIDPSFDLASLTTLPRESFELFLRRFGYFLIAQTLRARDRRVVARTLASLKDEPRQWVLDDLREQQPLDARFVARLEEVTRTLRKKHDRREDLCDALALYALAVAAGRRKAQRLAAIAMRCSVEHRSWLESFARRHATTSRRGLEPLAHDAARAAFSIFQAPSEVSNEHE